MTNNEQLRIDNMLATGQISTEDHTILTEALGNRKNKFQWMMSYVFDPFASVSSGTALAIGVALMLAMSFFGSQLGIYFPGAIDLQIAGKGRVFDGFGKLLFQNGVAVLSIAGAFFVGALLFKKRNLRLIDFLGFVALARLPYALFTFVLFFLSPAFPSLLPRTDDVTPGGGMIVIAILSLAVLVWQGVLMFSAQKYASGLKGKYLWISFVLGLIVAEALSYIFNSTVIK